MAVRASEPSSDPQRATATFIEDGDGGKFRLGTGAEVTCRVAGVNAPETAKSFKNQPNQAYGQEAKKVLERMILNKEVTIQVSYAKDRHGRNICQVDIEGKDVSQELVRAGAAMVYARYNKNPALLGIQAEAKNAKRGLWQFPDPIDPEIYSHSFQTYAR